MPTLALIEMLEILAHNVRISVCKFCPIALLEKFSVSVSI